MASDHPPYNPAPEPTIGAKVKACQNEFNYKLKGLIEDLWKKQGIIITEVSLSWIFKSNPLGETPINVTVSSKIEVVK